MVKFFNDNLGEDPFPTATNDELVIMYREGKCGFNPVLGRFHSLLLAKSQTWVPGSTQEDLYQDLAMRLFHCIPRWDPEQESFMTYLYTSLNQQIAWNIRKQGKTQKRRINYLYNESYEHMLELEVEPDIPESWSPSCDEETKKAIEILCSVQLTDQEKICVELLFDGRLKSEIADELHLTRTRVSQIFHSMAPKFQFLLSEY
jgi:RNA polymerase sigma factor (sigma-70 family)